MELRKVIRLRRIKMFTVALTVGTYACGGTALPPEDEASIGTQNLEAQSTVDPNTGNQTAWYESTDTPLVLSGSTHTTQVRVESEIVVPDHIEGHGAVVDLKASVSLGNIEVYLSAPSGRFWKLQPQAPREASKIEESFFVNFAEEPGQGRWELTVLAPPNSVVTIEQWRLGLLVDSVRPSFAFDVSPKEAALFGPGDQQKFKIDLGPIFNFSEDVTLSWTAEPNLNADVSFSANPVAPDSSSVMTVKTHEDTTPRSYTITVTGQSKEETKSVALTLKMGNENVVSYENKDTPLELSYNGRGWGELESEIVVPDGLKVSAAAVNLKATVPHDNATISLYAPSGTFWRVKPQAPNEAGDVDETVRLRFAEEPGRGTWRLHISAPLSPTSTLRDWDLKLATEPMPAGFDIDVSPKESEILGPADPGKFKIDVGSTFGFSDDVTLTWTAEPNLNADVSFSANPVVPGSSALMNIKTHAETAPGKYSITITGQSGEKTKSVNVTLTVANKTVLFHESKDTPLGLSYHARFWGKLESEIVIPDGVKVSGAVVDLKAALPHENTTISLHAPSGKFWRVTPQSMKGGGATQETVRLKFAEELGRGTWRLTMTAPSSPVSTLHSWRLGLVVEGFSPTDSTGLLVGTTGPRVNHLWASVPFDHALEAVPVTLAAMQTRTGKDPAGLRMRNLDATGLQIMIEEEDSTGDGVSHIEEDVGYIALSPGPIVNADGQIIGEAKTAARGALNADDWHLIEYEYGTYANPVVFMNMTTVKGPHPAHVRLRHVRSTSTSNREPSFEFKIEEWGYLDGPHAIEELSYVVLEEGTHTLADGRQIVAAAPPATNATDRGATQWEEVLFLSSFSKPPVVLSQVQTYLGPDPIVARQDNVTSTGFSVQMQEEKINNGLHTFETIGYIAVGDK